MILSMFTICGPVSFATDINGIMKSYNSEPARSEDYHAYKTEVVTITFLDEIDNYAITECGKLVWDVSENQDGSVMAWMKLNETETELAGTINMMFILLVMINFMPIQIVLTYLVIFYH